MSEIEALIQRKELQQKIECFTQAGLTQRVLALKEQLARLCEISERSLDHCASKGVLGNQVVRSKSLAFSFQPWEIDDILFRAYRWFISIPSADRMGKRFRNPLLEQLLLVGESLSLDGEVLGRVRNKLREHSEGLEWRDWYWLLYHRIKERLI